MQWNSKHESREAIKTTVTDYYHQFKEQKKLFEPGDRITYADRELDEKEIEVQ